MSLRRAINEKCKDCIYDPLCGGGNWRQQVSACAIKSCPLWPYRPQSQSRAGVSSQSERTAEMAPQLESS